MTTPTHVFIELDPDPHSGGSNLAAEARFGLVAYRKRPPDSTCQHPLADFGKPEKRDGHTMVSCVCLGCGLEWAMCRVVSVEQLASLGGQDDG